MSVNCGFWRLSDFILGVLPLGFTIEVRPRQCAPRQAPSNQLAPGGGEEYAIVFSGLGKVAGQARKLESAATLAHCVEL